MQTIILEPDTPSQIGQAMRDADAALNHLIELRNDPETRKQIADEENEIWRLKGVLEWLLSSIRVEQAMQARENVAMAAAE